MRKVYRSLTIVLLATFWSGCHSDSVTAPLSSSTLLFNEDASLNFPVLYSIATDGTGRRQLTPSGTPATTFAVAPDARRIAVTVADAPAPPIWILDSDGKVVQKLASPPADSVGVFGDIFDVESWSPNGALLVGGRNPQLAEMTTSGGFQRITTDNMSYGGVFSPDGSRIAFGRSGAHGTEIAVMNADGSNIQYLTNGNGGAGLPAWSPDGRRIAFERMTSSTVVNGVLQVTVALFVMNADGTNLVQLSPDGVYDGSPTWSPDGQQLAFVRSTDGGNNFDVYIMNADGSSAHAITSDGRLKHWVRWSPG